MQATVHSFTVAVTTNDDITEGQIRQQLENTLNAFEDDVVCYDVSHDSERQIELDID